MKKALVSVVAVLAVVAFACTVSAEEKYPTQEATVKTIVTTPDGKVVKEDVVTDTTKGADTASQYKELQKGQTDQEMKTEGKKEGQKAVTPKKKKAVKKSVKKSKTKAKEAVAPAATAAPEAPAAK